MYKKFLKSINSLNELTIKNTNIDDIARYSESDIYWATKRNNSFDNRKIKKGDIFQFEFGKNFIPEMSYEHRGLVIGQSDKLLYVLPICSYNPTIEEHKQAFHPIDNNVVNCKFYLLKKTEFGFLAHDSVLKLDDLRSVSTKRIKYKQTNSFIYNQSDTYKNIERMAFGKCFPSYSYNYSKLEKNNEELTLIVEKLRKELQCLKTEQ